MLEDVTLQQFGDFNALLNQWNEGIMEHEAKSIVILVLDDVINDWVEGSDLVVLKCNFDGCHGFQLSIDILLHVIEQRILLEVMLCLTDVVEEAMDHSTLETEDLQQTSLVKLHEWLEKDAAVGLEVDQLEDTARWVKHEYTLHQD